MTPLIYEKTLLCRISNFNFSGTNSAPLQLNCSISGSTAANSEMILSHLVADNEPTSDVPWIMTQNKSYHLWQNNIIKTTLSNGNTDSAVYVSILVKQQWRNMTDGLQSSQWILHDIMLPSMVVVKRTGCNVLSVFKNEHSDGLFFICKSTNESTTIISI